MRRRSAALAVGLAASMLALAHPSQAEQGDERPFSDRAARVGEIVFDVAILRPLNAAALLLGGVFFAASAPFVWPGGGLDAAYDVFVYAPYEYTIVRPLGEF